MSTENDVAIVGLAGIFPKAPDLKGFWHLIRAGVDAWGLVIRKAGIKGD